MSGDFPKDLGIVLEGLLGIGDWAEAMRCEHRVARVDPSKLMQAEIAFVSVEVIDARDSVDHSPFREFYADAGISTSEDKVGVIDAHDFLPHPERAHWPSA